MVCGVECEAGQQGQQGDESAPRSQGEAPADIASTAKARSAANIFWQSTAEF
jgi:hypothetical protein